MIPEDEKDSPECGGCGLPIEGEPYFDESQLFWLGRSKATPFHNIDCAMEEAEAQSHKRTHDFYAA